MTNNRKYLKECVNKHWNERNQVEDELHAAMGLVAESGEVVDLLKKKYFYGHNLTINPREITNEQIADELGDVLFYLTKMCDLINVDLSDIMKLNYDKLEKRHGDGFNPDYKKET